MRAIPLCLIVLLTLSSVLFVPLPALAQEEGGAPDAIGQPAAQQPPADNQPADTQAAEEGMTTGEAFVRKLIQGGWTMFFLLLASIVGVAVAIERTLRLRRSAIVPLSLADDADKLWRAGKYDELRKRADASNSTLGRIIVSLVRHRTSPTSDVSALAGDIASRDLRRHLQRAYPLLVVATIAPLLGLLGTVIGMIGAFATIEALGEMANPAAFGGDISKALITTGAGLGVAVPALAAYHFFKSRTTNLGVELEEVGSELISEWFVLSGGKSAGASSAVDATPKARTPAEPSAATGPGIRQPQPAGADVRPTTPTASASYTPEAYDAR